MFVYGSNFIEALEQDFAESYGRIKEKALGLEYTMDEMLRIIALHLRFTTDPMVDIDAFVADGYRLGIKEIILTLKEIFDVKDD